MGGVTGVCGVPRRVPDYTVTSTGAVRGAAAAGGGVSSMPFAVASS